MSYEPRLLAPFYKNSGLSKYFKPWLIGDEAFETMDNAFTWRGMIKKRDGYSILGRLPAQATISAISNASPAVVTTAAAHGLAAATPYHVWLEGISDTSYSDLNGALYIATQTAPTTFSITDLHGVNINKAAVGAPAGAGGNVYLPIQSFASRIVPNTRDEQLVAFDPLRAWLWNTTTSAFNDISFNPTPAAITWTGNDANYFWSTNFADSLWVTNFVDNVRIWNGSTTAGWSNQQFQTNGVPEYVHRALMIIPFKGRLVLLRTFEGTVGAAPGLEFAQRARWGQIGTPYVPTLAGPATAIPATSAYATDANAWRDDIPGRGGYIDAPTNENIVSAEIVNDNLIVFFQRSTWRLRYTGNQVLPFVWEEINGHLGSEATFGTVGFDQLAFSFSRYGFIGASTNNVNRIDESIPDASFYVETGATNEELNRVQAIRDFYRGMYYWSYPDSTTNDRVPTKMLAYNYDEQNWSRFDIGVRCFGSYKRHDDRTWASMTQSWAVTNTPWRLTQDNFPQVVGGLENGTAAIFFEPNVSSDDQAYTITGITAANPAVITVNRSISLKDGDEVYIDEVTGTMNTVLNGQVLTATATGTLGTTFSVPVDTTALAYGGGGYARKMDSTINFDIRTKRFNPYISKGASCRLQYFDLYMTGTTGGSLTLEHYIDADDTTPVLTRIIDTNTAQNAKYIRVFLGVSAEFHQLRLFLSDTQMLKFADSDATFELQGIVIHTRPESRIRQKATI